MHFWNLGFTARSPLSVASLAGSVCDAMATAAVVGAAMMEGAAASRSASSNLGMRHAIECGCVPQCAASRCAPILGKDKMPKTELLPASDFSQKSLSVS